MDLPGVVLVIHDVYADKRGSFMQLSDPALTAQLQGGRPFLQTNESVSRRLVLRGLHWQEPAQTKLVRVLEGEILDAVADVRAGSPTFGSFVLVQLRHDRPESLFIPAGYAHGFLVFSPTARVQYQCDTAYAPDGQRGVRWDDPTLAIPWKTTGPVLSAKDAALPILRDIPPTALPRYE
jgi:dTDP-4-dehydrorhamnose 3,5-epimerase